MQLSVDCSLFFSVLRMYYYVSIEMEGLSVLTFLMIKESVMIKAPLLKKGNVWSSFKKKLSQITQILNYIFSKISNVLEHRFS